MSKEKKNTYGQILKSSALIGSASMIGLGFGIIRNKAMAMILGAAGLGLAGNFISIIELVRTLAGMGISNSGVRQIAEAVGSGDVAARGAHGEDAAARGDLVGGFGRGAAGGVVCGRWRNSLSRAMS